MHPTITRTKRSASYHEHEIRPSSPARPRFNSHTTSDRLREGANLQALVSKMTGRIPKGRRSVFTEIGLDDGATDTARALASSNIHGKQPPALDQEDSPTEIPPLKARPATETSSLDEETSEADTPTQRAPIFQRQNSAPAQPWYTRLPGSKGRPRVKSASGAPPRAVAGLHRIAMVAMLIALVVPAFNYCSRQSAVDMSGAEAGPLLRKRETSPTDVCRRWAHQAAHVNGSLYIYGGEAKKDKDQESNTWNSYFLTLDLTKDWSTDSPALEGLEVPDGPPAVANGYLWQDYDNLYLYGGQFSDTPYVDPEPESLWKYSIKDEEWTEYKEPETSSGNYSVAGGEPVHRAAEGAGLSVPELGLSWYFGGHLDWATVPGWSRDVDRVYLKSLLEFTHPGYSNTGVDDLSGSAAAADAGVFRNITEGGVQKDDFPERADGVLVFVPGWGEQGALIGLAGGTADTFTPNFETLTVYDIANSEWYHQETTGDPPEVRVNPCAVIASAPDASSFQIYMFGGQNLPYGSQKQYNDMYILTIPSFTWIKVESDDNTPRGRAGHTCTMRDGQIIVVGGFMGEDVDCESPGIHVFDASTLEWKSEFKAGDHEADLHPENSVLAGSYGYKVPEVVQEIIGGDEEGGATATEPADGPATGGPFATGEAPVFTVTEAADAGDGGSGGGGDAPTGGLIAAGVIAGVTGALAMYLGFCAWLYRRQVAAYKRHLAVANRYSGSSVGSVHRRTRPFGGLFPGSGRPHRNGSQDSSEETFGWVGSDRAPPGSLWTPDAASTAGTGSGSAAKRSEDTSGEKTSSPSGESTEDLLDGEPSFFSVVMGPRRALRVVNGLDSP